MSLAVECAPDTAGRRVRVEMFESHDGERCDCVRSEIVLAEGDTACLSETVTCEGCGVARNFALNIRLVEVVDA